MSKPGRWALTDRRWPALRQQALRRDDYKCVKCSRVGRLEIDHVKSVRNRPDLAFVLDNLQTLCSECHQAKTRQERGLPPPDPERRKWRQLLRKPL